jgi:hypothetical protein
MMALPTPETDAEIHRVTWEGGKVTEHHAVSKDFARKLERERDDLQNAISGLCEHFEIHPASATFLAVELLRIESQRKEMAEILRDILAYDKGDKPHDYWALQNQGVANAMAFDAWQEILRKIEQALETEP